MECIEDRVRQMLVYIELSQEGDQKSRETVQYVNFNSLLLLISWLTLVMPGKSTRVKLVTVGLKIRKLIG